MSTVQQPAILGKIRSRGFWKVVIRPTTFQQRRIASLDELFPIVAKNSVRLRGWDYPHIDRTNRPQIGSDWVGQECDWQDEIEIWCLYLSGQFVHFFAMAGDWRDRSTFWDAEAGWEWGHELYYLHTIYSLVEIFEFASRLAISTAGDDLMHVEIDLGPLKGRQIVSDGPAVWLTPSGQTEATQWRFSRQYSQADLIANPRESAATATQHLFEKFGLNVSLDVLRELQRRIGR